MYGEKTFKKVDDDDDNGMSPYNTTWQKVQVEQVRIIWYLKSLK